MNATTATQQTRFEMTRQAIAEARRRKDDAEARRSAHYSELMGVLARIKSPAADMAVEEMERLVIRELALRRLVEASPTLIEMATNKLRDAEKHLEALADYKEQITRRIKDRRAQLALGAPLHMKVYESEQTLERAKRNAPQLIAQTKTDAQRYGLSSYETRERVNQAEREGGHHIQEAEGQLALARKLFAQAEQQIANDEAELAAIG